MTTGVLHTCIDRMKIRDERGEASQFITFIVVTLPILFLIFTMFDLSNLAHYTESVNRSAVDTLTRICTSPYQMGDAERWEAAESYLLSQGNVYTQVRSVQIVKRLPQTDQAERGVMYVSFTSSDDPTLRIPGSYGVGATSYVNIVDAADKPPAITMSIMYRYKPLIAGWLIGDSVFVNSFRRLNEHPAYKE